MERKTKVVLWIEALAVALLVFSGVLLSYFSSVASLNTVLKDSGSYAQIATIAQTRINELIPEDVKSSPIAYATINWGVDKFINEALIEKLSTPTLNGLVKLSKTPTTIVGTDIMLDTAQYKTKLTTDINGFNIPQSLKDAGNSFVNAIPAQLKVVDLNKHPNSILAKVIKAKERINQLRDVVLSLSLLVIALAVLLAVWSKETITRAVKTLSLTAIAGGGATLIAAGILMVVVKNVPLYAGETVLDSQINTLMVNLSNYYLNNVVAWGWAITAVSLVIFIFTIDKVQAEIKHLYQGAKRLLTPPKAEPKKGPKTKKK